MGVSGVGSNNNNVQWQQQQQYQQVQQPQQNPQVQQNQGTQQNQVQPAQQNQPTQYQQNLNKDTFSAGAAGQNNSQLTGQGNNTQGTQNNTQSTQGTDSVPELGSSGKTSAADLINKSGSGQTYPQNGAETRPGYGQQKQNMWDAAKSVPGVSDQEAALMVAQMQQEGERDVNKSGSSENFGPLNLNKDMLEKHGNLQPGQLEKMNQTGADGKPTKEAMQATAQAAHNAIQNMGADGYLHHVRGGDTGYKNPNQQINPGNGNLISDDPAAFARTLAGNAQKVLQEQQQNGSLAGNDTRVAANIPGI